MKFKDFQNLNYKPNDSIEFVLFDLLFKQQIDVNTILSAYTNALEKERRIGQNKFEEACVNITQLISPHFKKKKEKMAAIKRAIHTFNYSKTLPHNIHSAIYGYTEEDKKEFDNLCKLLYGDEFKDW